MKKTLRVSVLVMLLACSTYAGDMPNGVVSTPPPTTEAVQVTGEETQSSQETVSSVADVLLTLLQSILALF